MDPDKQVAKHYGVSDLESRILAALEAEGKNLDALTVDDLGAVDEFHIRGRVATAELASWVEINGSHRVLDVGCGVGGTARYLAATRGCHVDGVDLTPEYCKVASSLSARVGMAEKTTFQEANALHLPFDDGAFDVVWTEHVQMNIEDKARFYGEIRRVLKPGAYLVFHDIFAGPNKDMVFPVPWATSASISHLMAVEDVQSIIAEKAFETIRWENRTEASQAFFQARLEHLRTEGPPAIGLHLLMENAREKFENTLTNLESDALQVVAAVLKVG